MLRRHASRVARSLAGKLRVARAPRVPWLVNWDLTYACPLRCDYCYSESGRRSSSQLPLEELLRVADVLLAVRPLPEIVFSGGEPLVVKGYLELAEHLLRGGARLSLYTSGWKLRPDDVPRIVASFARIGVSVDAADPALNDRLRGRAGAHAEAWRALGLLDDAVGRAPSRPLLGVECSVGRSNLSALPALCRAASDRFPALGYITLGAVIPTGLASRESYARAELLDEQGLAQLRALGPRLSPTLRQGVTLRVIDNLGFMMRDDQLRGGRSTDHLVKIEADGRMRAMDIYEGTVGHLLEEPFDVLWQRAVKRAREPFVEAELGAIGTLADWASATRAIDRRFASPEVLVRLRRRDDAERQASGGS